MNQTFPTVYRTSEEILRHPLFRVWDSQHGTTGTVKFPSGDSFTMTELGTMSPPLWKFLTEMRNSDGSGHPEPEAVFCGACQKIVTARHRCPSPTRGAVPVIENQTEGHYPHVKPEAFHRVAPATPSAPSLLRQGVDAMTDRAASRDNEGERSMMKTIKAFNAFTDRDLTEEEGWLFMVCLKEARSMNGSKKIADDYADGAAYFALQGECALREQQAANQPSISDLAKQGRDSKRRQIGEEAGEGVLCGPANFYIAGEGWNKGVVYEAPEGLRIRYDGEPTKSVALSEVDKVREIKPTS